MSNTEEIFRKEQLVLEEIDKLLASDLSKLPHKELISKFLNFRNAYEKNLKQQVKFVKLADSSQGKLRKFQVELDETNKKINAQNEELTKLNQTKDKFFSIVSHDIRNPLTAIMLMGELLKANYQRMSADDLNKQIVKISDSIKLLFELFENLHRWSKAQSGILDFNPEEFNFLLIINKVFDLLRVHSDNKSISLISEIEPDDLVYGDKNMIETIIRNLVNNAIKFTHEGGSVTVRHRFDKA